MEKKEVPDFLGRIETSFPPPLGRLPLPSGGWIGAQLLDPAAVETALREMEANAILPRLWQHDHTVWKPDPDGIINRLGWLNVVEEMESHIGQLEALTYAVQSAGYTHVLVLGMGGSSLAPELYSRMFSGQSGLRLEVQDSTDPGAVLARAAQLDPARTLFIVSTKSGPTVETMSFFKYFYNWTAAALGPEQAGEHFIAITDPGSSLLETAQRHSFRAAFLNDPNIGGRFSALSFFGLVPAALCGLDLALLLGRAHQMMRACGPQVPVRENPAALLGAVLGELAKTGQDKVTFVLPPELVSFGDWVEQLIAESTGKDGRGILPVVREALGHPDVYGPDRVFVHIDQAGIEGRSGSAAPSLLEDSRFPAVHIRLQDAYDLGGQFFLWELATAIAGYRLGINPFDQPNVESAKIRAREMVAAYRETGHLPEETPQLSQDGIAVYGPEEGKDLETGLRLPGSGPSEALVRFLSQAKVGDYIALQAFIEPTESNDKALFALRLQLRDRYHLATTSGFGPRFLHSTGQLHKGDAGNGLFIQFTTDAPRDVPIPDEAGSPSASITFGVLKLAQAMGDRRALLDAGRRVIRFHLSGDPPAAIRRLAETHA